MQQIYNRIDDRVETLEQRTSEIQGTLHEHTTWQGTMGHEVAQVQQQQNLQLQQMDTLFRHFGI